LDSFPSDFVRGKPDYSRSPPILRSGTHTA
jgi:hypothetical protein